MNVYEKMECDIFHNSLIDQNDLLKQAEEENDDNGAAALYSSFTTLLNAGDEYSFEYLAGGSVKSKIPKYT